MMQQNGGLSGPGGASLGAGIGALMQTLGNLNQGQKNAGGGGSSVFSRLGSNSQGQATKPATPAGLAAGQSPWQKNKATPATNQGSPAFKKNESPQKVSPAGGKGGAAESPAAAKPDESQGVKTPQNQPWQQRNQGSGGRWGPNQNQNQQNSGGRNQQGGGDSGGGNWQQRNNQTRQSPAAGGGAGAAAAAAAGGGGGRGGGGGGQQGNWQGGQNRGGGQWGQNRGGDNTTSPQQQNDNHETPRRGGRPGGRGGRNESPQTRNYGGNRGGDGGGAYGGGRGGYRGGYDKIRASVMQLSGAQLDLEPMEFTEKKFNANSRLFVGNLPRDLEEEELREMFSKYGELGQFYFNKEGSYAFINFDFRCNAEKAKRELQSHNLKGRAMKIRVASVTTGVRVKNLSSQVSNELLQLSFSVFGEVETCRVMVNERGKATGEGIVIFADKKAWTAAIRKCEEECYFLTSDTRPCVVEPLDSKDEEEGLPEISMPKNNAYQRERQLGPRFADPQSFEFDYGQRYKRLFEIYKERKSSLDRDFATELDQLEERMAIAKHDFETEQLRRELERREADMDRLRRRASFGMGDSYGSGYGGAGGGAGAGSQQGGVGGYGGSGLQQSGSFGGPGSQQTASFGGPGSQQTGGAGYGGNDSQQFRSPQVPPTQGGYGASPAMQGEDYPRGMKRQAIGDLEPDTPSGTATDGPNEFKRRF